MTIDSTNICPKCYKKHQDEMKEKEETLKTLYGKITQEQYEQAKDEIKFKWPDNFDMDLMEYHGTSTSLGNVVFQYSCFCNKCKFEWSYNQTIKIPFEPIKK